MSLLARYWQDTGKIASPMILDVPLGCLNWQDTGKIASPMILDVSTGIIFCRAFKKAV